MTVNNNYDDSNFCFAASCCSLTFAAGCVLFCTGGIMMILNKVTLLSAGIFAGSFFCWGTAIGGGFLIDRSRLKKAPPTKTTKSSEIYASTIEIAEAKEKVSQLARFKEDNL